MRLIHVKEDTVSALHDDKPPFLRLLIVVIIISIILPLNCLRMLSKRKSFIAGESTTVLFTSCNKMYVMIVINVCLLL